MKLSFTTLACPEWDLKTILARAKEYGYDAIDFRGYGKEMLIYKLPEFSTGAAATARQIADSGLVVSGLSSGALLFSDPAKQEAFVEEVSRYAELADVLNVPLIRVFGGRLGGAELDRAVDQAAAMAERLAAAAGDRLLAIETHDDWTDSHLMVRLMQSIRAKNACVLWDLHHPYRMSGESPETTWGLLGKYVRAVHVKDGIVSPEGKYVYTLPGQGTIPLVKMIDLMQAGGYDGYLTLEWEKRWHPELAGPEVSLPAYAEFLRRWR
ncbi:MAG TPA: sugar phosphate isomerase/epimerase [Phycisphaerales bacterium]|nr:sugar phosphate isomerase/epimerase [Phycisphaerales bacterium]